MSGTKQGGQRAAATNKRKYGKDYYAEIGTLGGRVSQNKGFAVRRELAATLGDKGRETQRRQRLLKRNNLTESIRLTPHGGTINISTETGL